MIGRSSPGLPPGKAGRNAPPTSTANTTSGSQGEWTKAVIQPYLLASLLSRLVVVGCQRRFR